MPPKDQKVIESTFRLARYVISNPLVIPAAIRLAFQKIIESKDETKLAAKLTNMVINDEELKASGFEISENKEEKKSEEYKRKKREKKAEIRSEIKKVREDFLNSENPDKRQVQELKGELSQKDSLLEERNQEVKKVLEEKEKIRELSLQEGEAKGRTQEMKILTDVVRDVLTTSQETKGMILDIKQSINQQLLTQFNGEYKDRKIQQLEFKAGVNGLGLSTKQRKEIKKIIKSMAGESYANSFDLIAGDDVDVSQIFDGLMGIALSLVVPIPNSVLERMSKLFRERFNFDLSSFFDNITAPGDNKVLLTTPLKASSSKKLLPDLASRPLDNRLTDTRTNRQEKKATQKRRKLTQQGAILGAVVGAVAGSIDGSIGTSSILGGSIGATVGAATELISQSNLPRVASVIGQVVESTPQLLITDSVRNLGTTVTLGTGDTDNIRLTNTERQNKFPYKTSLDVALAASIVPAVVGDAKNLIGRFWKETPIDLPKDVLTEQQDTRAAQQTSKGMLRPKFIIPSVDILQPSEQELAADALEYSSFDFVKPGSEGGEGDLKTNVLKRIQQENDNIRFRGAGIDIMPFGQQFGVLPFIEQKSDINKLFLLKLPPMKFNEQDFNLSEFETRTYDPTNMRTAFEIFSPYDDFSDTIPEGDNEMSESMLFSIVP